MLSELQVEILESRWRCSSYEGDKPTTAWRKHFCLRLHWVGAIFFQLGQARCRLGAKGLSEVRLSTAGLPELRLGGGVRAPDHRASQRPIFLTEWPSHALPREQYSQTVAASRLQEGMTTQQPGSPRIQCFVCAFTGNLDITWGDPRWTVSGETHRACLFLSFDAPLQACPFTGILYPLLSPCLWSSLVSCAGDSRLT